MQHLISQSREMQSKVFSVITELGFKTFENKVTWMQALHLHAENRNGFFSLYHCAVTMVLSLVFLSRCSDDQWHQCRHERWDRPSQELPESGGHHWEVQGGHLLLWQGNFTHRNVRVSSALSEMMYAAVEGHFCFHKTEKSHRFWYDKSPILH